MQTTHHPVGTETKQEAAFQMALAYLGIEQDQWHAYKDDDRLGADALESIVRRLALGLQMAKPLRKL